MLNYFNKQSKDVETVVLEDGSTMTVPIKSGQGYPDSLKKEIERHNRHYSKVNRKEGDTRHPLYYTFKMMTYVCENPHRKDYHLYGGKGIKVAEEWHFPENFHIFLDWAHDNGYDELNHCNLKLIRIDKNGDYCPSNCRFVLR